MYMNYNYNHGAANSISLLTEHFKYHLLLLYHFLIRAGTAPHHIQA